MTAPPEKLLPEKLLREPILLDHAVHLVHDLPKAEADFRALGFVVQSRADLQPGHGAQYRFVVFRGGSYLLLTQFLSAQTAAAHRLGPDLAEGEGYGDYCFALADVDAAQAALAARAQPSRGPVAVENRLADGRDWALRLLMAGKGATALDQGAPVDMALPFLIADVTGRAARIPPFQSHPNGLNSLAGVAITTPDAAASATRLGQILGLAPQAWGAGFRLSAGLPVDILPDPALPGAAKRGRQRGGLYEITLAPDGGDSGPCAYAPGSLLDLQASHGARLRLQGPDPA